MRANTCRCLSCRPRRLWAVNPLLVITSGTACLCLSGLESEVKRDTAESSEGGGADQEISTMASQRRVKRRIFFFSPFHHHIHRKSRLTIGLDEGCYLDNIRHDRCECMYCITNTTVEKVGNPRSGSYALVSSVGSIT
jgi:hypothetical protein